MGIDVNWLQHESISFHYLITLSLNLYWMLLFRAWRAFSLSSSKVSFSTVTSSFMIATSCSPTGRIGFCVESDSGSALVSSLSELWLFIVLLRDNGKRAQFRVRAHDSNLVYEFQSVVFCYLSSSAWVLPPRDEVGRWSDVKPSRLIIRAIRCRWNLKLILVY